MVRPFFTNVRLLILTIILIFSSGLAAYQSLPRQEDPQLVSRTAVITTAFPGASAERVEALVTTVLEEELSSIEEISVIESDSRVGFSSVLVELEETIQNAQPVWSKVRDELDDAVILFPPGASEPELDEVLIKAYTFVASLTWRLPDAPNYAVLSRYAEELGVMMRGLGGTEEVDFFGNPQEEILVEIDAPKLAAVGLSPQQLVNQVSLSDAKSSAGQLRTPSQTVAIELENELANLEQIRQIPVQLELGRFTRLSDIAQVSRGVRDPMQDLALIDGQPAIVLGAMMQSGLRIDQWATAMNEQIENFRDRLPDGLSLDIIFDQSAYVSNRIDTLTRNLILGAALVVGVTLVAMGWRSAVVVGSALPLCVLLVFGWMTVFGVPIHQMSVTGLIIALGLLIDNAIVVVDEIQMELQHGTAPLQAASKTVNYLKVPLLASTLTTIMTFLPIYLLPGSAGEFVGSIALSVILALVSSLAISLTVIPALAAHILGRSYREKRISIHRDPSSLSDPPLRSQIQRGAWWTEGISLSWLVPLYRWSIGRAVTQPLLTIGITLSIPLVGFILAGTLDTQFFPLLDRDQFQIEIEFSAQTAIEKTRQKVIQARDVILEQENVAAVHWFIGESAPRFYYNLQADRQNEPYYAQAMVQLKSDAELDATVRQVQTALSRHFPSARVIAQKFQQGPPFDAPVEIRLYGPNLQELRRLGVELRQMLTTFPEVVHARDNLSEGQPKLSLSIDEEQARQAGLTNLGIAQQLEAYSEGVTGGAILESTENLPVRVRLTNRDRASLKTLASLDLRPDQSSDRALRPATALGDFELVPQLATITRRNEERVNTVQAFIEVGVLPSTVLAALQERLETENFQLPPGYRYEFGGEAEEQGDAVGNLLLFVPVLVLVMLTALVLSLNSFRQTCIMTAVAIGSIGMAMLSLKVFGSLLGFMAIIGSMGLVGIAINDSIVVLTAFNEDPEARQGNPKAVQRVLLRCTRHVVTTTATTIIGFLPLLLDGDPFWQPLVIAITGGITGASGLALYFVPAAYVLIMRRKSKPHQNPSQTNDACLQRTFFPSHQEL